jgi:hypothetical protein
MNINAIPMVPCPGGQRHLKDCYAYKICMYCYHTGQTNLNEIDNAKNEIDALKKENEKLRNQIELIKTVLLS